MSGITSGPLPMPPPLSEREKLRAALDGYNATDIGAMLEALSPGAGANRRKAERIEVLLRLLLDLSFVQRTLATVSPFGRRLLGVARRTGRTSIAALLLAGQDSAHDEESVRRELTARQEGFGPSAVLGAAADGIAEDVTRAVACQPLAFGEQVCLRSLAASGWADENQSHGTHRPENGTGALWSRPAHTFPS